MHYSFIQNFLEQRFTLRKPLRYTIQMIISWKHKGLRVFFQTGVCSGIQAKHQTKLKIILQLLDAATQPKDMDLPGMRFHPLKGELKNHYSVTVNANWRVIFTFTGNDATLVDYLDYH